MYGSVERVDIYSHSISSEDGEKKRFGGGNVKMGLRKGNHNQSDLMDNKDTKNININFSINNFSYVNETETDGKKFMSPGSFDLRKKKSSKRYNTQANADTMNSILSPSKVGVSRSKDTMKREEKKTPTKSNLKLSKNRKTSR